MPEYKFPDQIDQWPRRDLWYCGAVTQGIRPRAGEAQGDGDLGVRVVVVNAVGEMCWWYCRKDDIPIGVGGLIL